VWTLYIQ